MRVDDREGGEDARGEEGQDEQGQDEQEHENMQSQKEEERGAGGHCDSAPSR